MSQVSPPNYKTITLGRGKHASPYEGACVMELASMIAGEPFSDHPASVCPVIAGFLRVYNDSLDDRRRQDLYRYASMAIGTRGSREVEERRVARCLEWAREMSRRRSWFDRLQHPVRIARGWDRLAAAAGCAAAHEIRRHSDDTHAAALSFVEELCAMSDPEPRSSAAGRTAGPTRVRERVSPGSGVSSTA
ncbi:MAG TPA: hypothetical protein VKV21_03490 [Solirubrobacteraceae bacterium]|nr:hypothetical protein [Solirubrobacteraceae bacterium]